MVETNDTPPTADNAGAEPADQPICRDARTWAMFCHLAGLAGFVIPVILSGIIAPLIVWQLKKDQYAFVDEQGKEAVNFQISIGIYSLLSIPLCFICVGFFILGVVAIIDLVFLIIAAIKANNGLPYRYPLTVRLIK